MSDHRLEWSPASKTPVPEIVAAVDTVEARLFGYDGHGAAIHEHEQPYRMPVMTRADCELAGFDIDALKDAYRMEAR